MCIDKKGTSKYTGSEQGKRNYKQKLQESRKSIKEGNDWLCKAKNQTLKSSKVGFLNQQGTF